MKTDEAFVVHSNTLIFIESKPNYSITFNNDVGVIGALDFNGSEMVFEGATEESAKVFFEFIARSFSNRLKEEFSAGQADMKEQIEKAVAAERERCAEAILLSGYITGGGYHDWVHKARAAIRAKGSE